MAVALQAGSAATVNTYGTGVSTSGAKTHAIGGVTLTGTAMMVLSISYISPSTTATNVTSVTDSQGNTWQLYSRTVFNSGWRTAAMNVAAQKNAGVELWYTFNATAAASIDVTVTHSGNIDAAVMCLSGKLTGFNTVQPWDQNSSLPALGRGGLGGATVPSVTGISTNTTNLYPVWASCAFSSNIGNQSVTFNSISRSDTTNSQKNGTEFVRGNLSYGPAAASAYSGVTYTGATSNDNWTVIGGSITPDSQVNLAARPYAAMIG